MTSMSCMAWIYLHELRKVTRVGLSCMNYVGLVELRELHSRRWGGGLLKFIMEAFELEE